MRTPETTHKIMSSIKSANTRPELLMRKTLWNRGLRYRVNVRNMPGKPDIVFTRAKLVVFCDGDYWHGHNWAIRGIASLDAELAGYSEYWKNKILRNIERDKEETDLLKTKGWVVLRFWESNIKADVSKCADIVEATYRKRIKSLSIKDG